MLAIFAKQPTKFVLVDQIQQLVADGSAAKACSPDRGCERRCKIDAEYAKPACTNSTQYRMTLASGQLSIVDVTPEREAAARVRSRMSVVPGTLITSKHSSSISTPEIKSSTESQSHGDLSIDNNASERAMRPVAIGRKNWLFVGSKPAGHRAAILMSLIATCKANLVEPWTWLKDVQIQLPRSNHSCPAPGRSPTPSTAGPSPNDNAAQTISM